jgi:hypothetical protein
METAGFPRFEQRAVTAREMSIKGILNTLNLHSYSSTTIGSQICSGVFVTTPCDSAQIITSMRKASL